VSITEQIGTEKRTNVSIKEQIGTEKITNVSIKEQIGSAVSLENRVMKQKLSYFGLVVRANGLEKSIMLGMGQGGRGRGRQKNKMAG